MASTASRIAYSPAPPSTSPSEGTARRHGKAHGPRLFSAIERMEDEVRALEGIGGRVRWARWIFGVLVLGALLAVGSYFYLIAR